jgi:YfiH family protein
MTLSFQNGLRPVWPAPPHVHALMTDRHGGVSQAPWDTMNVGDHVGDCLQSTQINRQLLHDALGTRPVFLKQVHGVQSVLLDTSSEDGTQADACISVASGVACTIMVADCLPVLMCDASGRWVAAAHAGWRGLAGAMGHGVLEALLAASPLYETNPEDILVWLGPCIGPAAFEVGAEVVAAFCDGDPAAAGLFKPMPNDKWLADLPGLARLRLHSLGVTRIYGNDGDTAWCTVSQSSKFFSHRRDSPVFGHSGRMAACIWLGS